MMRGSFLSIIIQIMFSQQSPSFEDLKELYKLEKIHRLKLEQFQTVKKTNTNKFKKKRNKD